MAGKDKMKGIWRGLTYVPREQRLAEMEEERQSKLLAQQHKQAMAAERLQQEGRAKEIRTLADLGAGPRGMGVKGASVKAGMGKVSGVGTGGASATQVMKLFNDVFTDEEAKWAWERKLPKNDKDQLVDASGKALNQKQVDIAWRKFALEQTMAVKNELMGGGAGADMPKTPRPIFEGVGKQGERLFTSMPERYPGQELKPYGQTLSQKAGIGGGAQRFIDEMSPAGKPVTPKVPGVTPKVPGAVGVKDKKTPWWATGKSLNPMDLAMRMGATLGQDLWQGIKASRPEPRGAPSSAFYRAPAPPAPTSAPAALSGNVRHYNAQGGPITQTEYNALTQSRRPAREEVPIKRSTKRRATAGMAAPPVALPLSSARSVLRKPEEETKRSWYATR